MSMFAMKDGQIAKLVIFGTGLIGGSLARALRARQAARCIVGVDRTPEVAARAHALGLLERTYDLAHPGLAAELADAELVVLAAPVAQTPALLGRLAPFLSEREDGARGMLVTDTGSTKGDVVAAARAALGAKSRRFVPGHPIAGGEASGPDAALADLYAGRNVVLCPLPENSTASVARVAAMWRAAGATPCEMPADRHDALFASVSHLPHLLSFALIEQILRAPDAALRFAFAAGGFRDFTRIAASNSEMWRDICLANRAALLDELEGYTAVLTRLRNALAAGDGSELENVFARASAARAAWPAVPPDCLLSAPCKRGEEERGRGSGQEDSGQNSGQRKGRKPEQGGQVENPIQKRGQGTA